MNKAVKTKEIKGASKPVEPDAEMPPQFIGGIKESAITPLKSGMIILPLKNIPGSPLVIHAFDQKIREEMKAKQEAGSTGNKGKRREAKDFDLAYNNARHVSPEGWDGIAASALRAAAIDACRLVGFKMTLGKQAIFVEPDGLDAKDGMPLIRIHGKPKPFEAMVRVANGAPDIRIRPRWDDWAITLRVRYDMDLFTVEDIINLYIRAGEQVGVGEGRPFSKASMGQGWGMFQIDPDKSIECITLKRDAYKFVLK